MEKSMKVVITADIHYDLFQNISSIREDLLTDRALEIDTAFKSVLDYASAEKAPVIIAGDLVHRRNIRSDAINELVYNRLKYAKEQGVKVFLLVGNHDQANVAGTVHCFSTFQDVVEVIDKPCVKQIHGFDFFFLPYEEYRNSAKSLEILLKKHRGSKGVLVGHLGVMGASLSGFDHTVKEPLTVEDLCLDKFLFGYLGHYHLPQKVATNCCYVGSLMQHSLQDKRCDRGFTVAEFVMEGTAWGIHNKQIVLDTPTFQEIPVEQYQTRKVKGKQYFRVTGVNRQQAEALLDDPNVMGTTGITLEEVQDTEKQIETSLGWDEMIEAYVKLTEDNSRRRRRLSKLGKDFLG